MTLKKSKLDPKAISQLLAPGGALSFLIKHYEPRSKQQEMLLAIVDAYNQNKIGLIEAGTGIGKSLAYILPAIIWKKECNERTLISTHTISLQEQLMKKEIPLASKILNFPIHAVIVKGMSNYLCFKKLKETLEQERFLKEDVAKESLRIDEWSQVTVEGSLSDLPMAPSQSVWEKVSADPDSCIQKKCPYYEKCFFFKARNAAADAHLLIANHAMLFADLAYRAESKEMDVGLIPEYSRLILDEAHNIEDIATMFFAKKFCQPVLLKLLKNIGSEKTGKLSLMAKKLPHSRKAAALLSQFLVDLPAIRQRLLETIGDFFNSLSLFLDATNAHTQQKVHKLRMQKTETALPFWQSEVMPRAESVITQCKQFVGAIFSACKRIDAMENEKSQRKMADLKGEILSYSQRLDNIASDLKTMMENSDDPKKVFWIGYDTTNPLKSADLYYADLDISTCLQERIFKKFSTTVLLSATLSTSQNFNFVKNRFGLKDFDLIEKIYDSPFNYDARTLFLIAKNMPFPNSAAFQEAILEKIWVAVVASSGSAFILFTSYKLLNHCYQTLFERLKDGGYHPLKQGELSRFQLLEKFKKSAKAVLFATDSFWEGVDIPGEALRLVIIVKLPFKVPSEPMIEARTDAIKEKGGQPFYEYTLPNAIWKFKQGFGRLMRNMNDYGCVLCLDSRLIEKQYGLLFFKSLPNSPKLFVKSSQELQNCLQIFFKKFREKKSEKMHTY